MGSQFSGDSFAGALGYQTDFFKSIIALKAASEIFRILGDNEKTQQFEVRRLVLPDHRKVVKVPATERCHLVPGTMAGYRTLIGQVSLHPSVWEQPIVSVTGTNPVIFAVLM